MGRGTSHSDDALLADMAKALLAAAGSAGLGFLVTEATAGAEERVTSASKTAARILGVPAKALVGRPLEDLVVETDRNRLREWLAAREARTNAEPFIDVAVAGAADARTSPVRISCSTFDAGGVRGSVAFLEDRAASDHAAEAQRISEQRFRRVIETAPEAIGIGVREGIAYANAAMGRLLGHTDGESLLGTPFTAHVHPDDAERTRQRLQGLFDGTEWTVAEPIRVRRPDGRYAEVEFLGMNVFWDGQPAALVIGRDLGERKELQSQLIQADRFAAVGTLAAGVAHEINNPLAYMLLNLEYLIREVPRFDGSDEALQRLIERLDEVRHGADRVRSVGEDLRAFSGESGDLQQRVDVAAVAKQAARIARHELEGRARLVENYEAPRNPRRETDGPGPHVLGSAARLEQVLVNLLTNAAHAIPKERKGTVSLAIFEAGDAVVIEVTDDGVGIAPEHLHRVFDPFFTTKPAGLGTGLGLPICHSMVSSMSGTITVTSAPGHTVFRVTLPLAKGGAPDVGAPPPSETTRGPRARVLVIDDEPAVANMLSRLLEEDHDVEIATTARDALVRILDGDAVDVVLCDLLMPGMSGMDLHRELVLRRPGMERRIVFMTGGAFTQRAAAFLERAQNPYLEKPFDIERVLEVVNEVARASGKE